jgi:hypothetical protein
VQGTSSAVDRPCADACRVCFVSKNIRRCYRENRDVEGGKTEAPCPQMRSSESVIKRGLVTGH